MPKRMTNATAAPTVETSRLILRAHVADDFEASAAMWANPDVTRFIGGVPSTREASWGRLVRNVGFWTLLGFGSWVVEDRVSGSFAGEVGFAEYVRDIEPSLGGMPELGWVIAPRFHGRGFATEAVRAAVDWGDRNFGPVPTACLIDAANERSIRVARRAGFTAPRETLYKGTPVLVFTRGG